MTKGLKQVPGSEVEPISEKSNFGRLDNLGREIVDGRPMAPPLGYKKTPSIADQVREMVRSENLRLAAIASGQETFEEADDFDVDDDVDPTSPWEEYFDPGSVADYRAALEKELAELQGPPTPRSQPFKEPPEAAGEASKTPEE